MSNPESTPFGVRRDWMYATACAAQRLAGEILASTIPLLDVRHALVSSVPPPVNAIESCVLEAFVARAERETQHLQSRSDRSVSVARRAAALLRERYSESWTLPDLARTLGTNRFTLTTDFHATFGMSIHRHLVAIRVREASRRMDSGKHNLDTIAHDVGFRSRKTLYDAYKRVTGSALTYKRSRRTIVQLPE